MERALLPAGASGPQAAGMSARSTFVSALGCCVLQPLRGNSWQLGNLTNSPFEVVLFPQFRSRFQIRAGQNAEVKQLDSRFTRGMPEVAGLPLLGRTVAFTRVERRLHERPGAKCSPRPKPLGV